MPMHRVYTRLITRSASNLSAHLLPLMLTICFVLILTCVGFSPVVMAQEVESDGNPDIPSELLRGRQFDKAEYLRMRAEGIGYRRGIQADIAVDPVQRQQAVQVLNAAVRSQAGSNPAWQPVGPAPIPNGQTVGTVTAVSGRTISLAIHPTNPDIVYAGTANGGLYRSTNGGTSWTPLMDEALSLAIGALALAPSDPEILYVGTGEHNFSIDSFFGVGVYRIDNPSTTATLSGPFNRDAGNNDIFSGRGIGEIQVHPTDPDIIFVASTSGVGGIVATNSSLPSRGVYRSTNATSGSPVFAKLDGLEGGGNFSVRDIILDPLNPNLLIANVITSGGGLYVSNDALAAAPTFTRTQTFTGGTSSLTAEFAIHHSSGPDPIIYAATGNGGGRVLLSTDSGVSWSEQVDNNFCGGQCFYDIAIAVDPNDPTRVYLGGDPSLVFGISTNSGVSFTSSSTGLHADSHVIAVSESDPSIIYFGNDGGIYKSIDSGANWVSLNNTTFSATQFMGLATHPMDPEFMIGGTQDNGTNFKQPDGSWTRADFGDGGYAGIDQNATDTTNVRMYHTYFNAPSLQGYGTVSSINTAMEGQWAFRGCQQFGATVNGITCNGTIRFYAPLVLGPGAPNTVYYGSDRLYRSDNSGANHSVVSQNPIESGVPLSAIGIAPDNDNIRAVGLSNGGLWRTTNGSSTLINIDQGNAVPNVGVARIVIDAGDNNTAYVALSAFGVDSIWKTSNFLNDPPNWIAASTNLPQVPVNGLVIDPTNSSILFAGTDIGVYRSIDAGANWTAFSNGLPRSPVFDIAYQGRPSSFESKLRIATHGRGIWEVLIGDPDVEFADGFE